MGQKIQQFRFLILIFIMSLSFFSRNCLASINIFEQTRDSTAEEIYLSTIDGVRIAGNYYKRGHNQLLIVLNGLFMNKDNNFKYSFCEKLSQKYDILNIDFRGHGKSGGKFTGGVKEVFDIQTAVQFAKKNNYKKIGVLGFSFGGYMAVKGAALISEIDTIVTISAPYSINREQPKNFDQRGFTLLVTFGRLFVQYFIGIRYDDLPKEAVELKPYLKNLRQPILVIHGDWDSLVPYEDGLLIFKNAGSQRRFVTLKNGSHAESLSEFHMEIVIDEIFKWFDPESTVQRF